MIRHKVTLANLQDMTVLSAICLQYYAPRFQRFRGEIIKAPVAELIKCQRPVLFKGPFLFSCSSFSRIRWLNQAERSGFSSFADTELSAAGNATDTPDTNSKPECESFAPYDIPVVK